MKWVCTKINELSHKTGIGNMKLFIIVSMVVCGLAGCPSASPIGPNCSPISGVGGI